MKQKSEVQFRLFFTNALHKKNTHYKVKKKEEEKGGSGIETIISESHKWWEYYCLQGVEAEQPTHVGSNPGLGTEFAIPFPASCRRRHLLFHCNDACHWVCCDSTDSCTVIRQFSSNKPLLTALKQLIMVNCATKKRQSSLWSTCPEQLDILGHPVAYTDDTKVIHWVNEGEDCPILTQQGHVCVLGGGGEGGTQHISSVPSMMCKTTDKGWRKKVSAHLLQWLV